MIYAPDHRHKRFVNVNRLPFENGCGGALFRGGI